MPSTLHFDPTVRRVAPLLPSALLHRWVRWALDGREAALCLHRVGGMIGGVGEDPTGLTIPSHVLDDLLNRVRRIDRHREWLTLTFDDGYPDALDYVATRAIDFPTVGWRLFICPAKALSRSGFRWDGGLEPVAELPATMGELRSENGRAELLAAGANETTALATPTAIRALMADQAGIVGNHSNCHLPFAKLPSAIAEHELNESVDRFLTEFGRCDSFAFPFGSPGVHWFPEHAKTLSDRGVKEIWSVQSRTFTADERGTGQVLPRFPIHGHDDAHAILALIAARATVERIQRRGARTRRHALTPASHTAGSGYLLNEPLVHLGGAKPAAEAAAPVVLLHGGSGHVESFRHLAPLLGQTNPVFGVRALGVLPGEEPAADFREAIHHAIDAVKQLGQPVRIVGYSVGGLIALGVARALQDADLLAAPIVLIDTYSPAVEVLPLRVRLHHGKAFARRYGVQKLGPWAKRLVERQVRSLIRRPQTEQPWRHELGFGDCAHLGFVDLEPHFRQLIDDPDNLVSYDGPVRSIRSLELAPNLPDDAGIGELYVRTIPVELLRGDHFSLLTKPFVNKLAAAILQ